MILSISKKNPEFYPMIKFRIPHLKTSGQIALERFDRN